MKFYMNQIWYLVAIALFLLEGFEAAEFTDANGVRHIQRKLKGGGYRWVKVAPSRAVLTDSEESRLRLTIQNKAKLVHPDYFEEKVKEALDYEIKNNRVKTKDKETNVEKVVTLTEEEKMNLVNKAVTTLKSMYDSGMLGKRTKPVPPKATVHKPWSRRVSNTTESFDKKKIPTTKYKGSRLSPNPDKIVRKPPQSLPKAVLKVPEVQTGPPGGSGTTVSVKNGGRTTNVSIQTQEQVNTQRNVQFSEDGDKYDAENKENEGGLNIPRANQKNGMKDADKSTLGAIKNKLGFGASKDKSALALSTNSSKAVIDADKSALAVPKKKGASTNRSNAVKVTVTHDNGQENSVEIQGGMLKNGGSVSISVSRQAPEEPKKKPAEIKHDRNVTHIHSERKENYMAESVTKTFIKEKENDMTVRNPGKHIRGKDNAVRVTKKHIEKEQDQTVRTPGTGKSSYKFEDFLKSGEGLHLSKLFGEEY